MDELKKNKIIGDLYAYYGKLLTKNQQNYFEDYYYNDLSLSEIADNHQVSRQAVYDNLRRCRKLLQNYEDKLQMQKDYHDIEQGLLTLIELVKQAKQDQALTLINKLIQKMRED